MQHGLYDFAACVASLQATTASRLPVLVRVPQNDAGLIGQVLDAGAWGVICPMVNTAQEARRLVSASRYAPLGARSFGPYRAGAYSEPDAPYQTFANTEVLVIAMIETVEAIKNLGEILDVDGVDGIYVGPSDLSLSMGLDARFDREEGEFVETLRMIAGEAAQRGKFAGIHCLSPTYAKSMAQAGFTLTTIGSDAFFIGQAAATALAASRTNEGY